MKRVLVTACLFLCGCAHDPGLTVLNPEQGLHLAAIERSLVPSDAPEAQPEPVGERLRHWHVPAVSVAVFGDGEIKWAKAWGAADELTRQPVTTLTRFQAGSISKPVTATALLQLVDEGSLDLNGDINSALGSWKLPQHAWSSVAFVTPAELISHTAGVSVRSFVGYAADAALPTIRQILDGSPPANTAAVRVISRPGGGLQLFRRRLRCPAADPHGPGWASVRSVDAQASLGSAGNDTKYFLDIANR